MHSGGNLSATQVYLHAGRTLAQDLKIGLPKISEAFSLSDISHCCHILQTSRCNVATHLQSLPIPKSLPVENWSSVKLRSNNRHHRLPPHQSPPPQITAFCRQICPVSRFANQPPTTSKEKLFGQLSVLNPTEAGRRVEMSN